MTLTVLLKIFQIIKKAICIIFKKTVDIGIAIQ